MWLLWFLFFGILFRVSFWIVFKKFWKPYLMTNNWKILKSGFRLPLPEDIYLWLCWWGVEGKRYKALTHIGFIRAREMFKGTRCLHYQAILQCWSGSTHQKEKKSHRAKMYSLRQLYKRKHVIPATVQV